VRRLAKCVECPGVHCRVHTHWVFPILAADPNQAVEVLREAGFDATQGQSMCVVAAPADRPQLQPCAAADALRRIVYLPIYPEIPLSSANRMAEAVLVKCTNHGAASLPSEQQHCQAVQEDDRADHHGTEGRQQHAGAADIQRVAQLGANVVGDRPGH
jgi:hypothetical protein